MNDEKLERLARYYPSIAERYQAGETSLEEAVAEAVWFTGKLTNAHERVSAVIKSYDAKLLEMRMQRLGFMPWECRFKELTIRIKQGTALRKNAKEMLALNEQALAGVDIRTVNVKVEALMETSIDAGLMKA